MKLQGIHDGSVYATEGRTVLREQPDGSGNGIQFERVGRLPVPSLAGIDRVTYRLRTVPPWKSLVERLTGAFPTTNVWWITDLDVLATSGRFLFASHDGGRTWEVSRRLPPSSGPMGILPTGLCERDGTVFLGEYPLATGPDVTPRLLRSDDAGQSWRVELPLPDVRHVHAVRTDPYTGDVWVTTGDADDECRIGRLREGRLDVVGGGSQLWRAVDLAFTPDAVLWGVDCPYRERKEVLRLDRGDLELPDPTPEVVTTLPSSVYFAATFPDGVATWVAFSTAVEPGQDRTAPAGAATTNAGGVGQVVAASSATDYTEWHTLTSFEKATCPVDLVDLGGRLPVACAYVFLSAAPGRGLFFTPFNTSSGHGELYHIPVERLRTLAARREPAAVSER